MSSTKKISLADRKSVTSRVIADNRKTAFTSTLLILSAFIGFGLLGCWVIYTRPTKVDNVESNNVLVDAKSGKVLETGVSLYTNSLLNMSRDANFKAFDHITELHIPEMTTFDLEIITSPPTRSVRIQSWKWLGVGEMVFHAMDGTKVYVSGESISIMDPANGVVAFNSSNVAWGSDPDSEAVVEALATTCASHHCPNFECSALTSDGDLATVLCKGVPVWQWPQGVRLENASATSSRRELKPLGEGGCYGSAHLHRCKLRCKGGLPAKMKCHRKCAAQCAAASVQD